jgi:hypothetical protein
MTNITIKFLKSLIQEALEDRLNPELHDSESMEQGGWTEIPPEELHSALAGAIWDLYKYVNGVRPRWINFNEMSVEELENMHHGLTATMAQDDGGARAGNREQWEMEWEADTDEQDHMMTPEQGEDLPKHGGMGAARSHAPARNMSKRPRKPPAPTTKRIREGVIRDRIRQIVLKQRKKVLVENVTNIEFSEQEESDICAALRGMEVQFLESTAYTKLYEYFEGQIPYAIDSQASTAEMTPDEWILDQLDPSMFCDDDDIFGTMDPASNWKYSS